MSDDQPASEAVSGTDEPLSDEVVAEVAGAAAKTPVIMRCFAAVLAAPEDASVLDAIPAEYMDAFDPSLLLGTVLAGAQFAKAAGHTPESLLEYAEKFGDDAFRGTIAGG